MIRQNLFALTAVVFLLAACEVGPDYQPPQTDLPVSWLAAASSGKAEIDQQWWHAFHDPVLTQLIDRAIAGNADIKIAQARIAEARSLSSAAFAARLPTGDVKATATREANEFAFPDAQTSSLGQMMRKPYNIFQTGFDASWETDVFGANRRAEEAADAQTEAAIASGDDIRVSMLAEVARTYTDVRGAQAEISARHDILHADRKTLDLTRQRYRAGEVSRLDVIEAEAALQQTQSVLVQLQDSLAQSESALDVLLGAQPGAAKQIVIKPAPVPTADHDSAIAAPAAVIAQRPDIRNAERKLAAATAQQGVAVAQFFPKLSLNAFFGVLNTSVDQLVTPARQSWLASGSVIWPILNYGALSANLDTANAQQQEALVTYQKSVVVALSDVERALNSYREQGRYVQSVEIEAQKNTAARNIARERYQAGLTSLLNVLDSERLLDQSQINLVKARAQYSEDLIALYKSLGGGWQNMQPAGG